MTRSQSTQAVLRYFRGKPGLTMHYNDAAVDLNMSPQQINAALARAVTRHPEYGIRRIGSGQYRYSPKDEELPKVPATDPVQQIYEGVGVTKDGTRIVRDTDGVLWKLSERL